MGHYECKKCEQYYDDCTCGKTPSVATNATGATFERRGHVGERGNGEAERQSPREQSDRAMWDFVKSKPPPSARGSVTVRRPDGTTITCDVSQLQDVLEQAHKVRPRTVEITCVAVEQGQCCDVDNFRSPGPVALDTVLGFGPGIGTV